MLFQYVDYYFLVRLRNVSQLEESRTSCFVLGCSLLELWHVGWPCLSVFCVVWSKSQCRSIPHITLQPPTPRLQLKQQLLAPRHVKRHPMWPQKRQVVISRCNAKIGGERQEVLSYGHFSDNLILLTLFQEKKINVMISKQRCYIGILM